MRKTQWITFLSLSLRPIIKNTLNRLRDSRLLPRNSLLFFMRQIKWMKLFSPKFKLILKKKNLQITICQVYHLNLNYKLFNFRGLQVIIDCNKYQKIGKKHLHPNKIKNHLVIFCDYFVFHCGQRKLLEHSRLISHSFKIGDICFIIDLLFDSTACTFWNLSTGAAVLVRPLNITLYMR